MPFGMSVAAAASRGSVPGGLQYGRVGLELVPCETDNGELSDSFEKAF